MPEQQRLRTREHEALRLVAIAARKAARMSQDALALALTRPRSYVSKVENGDQQLTLIAFQRWIRACDGDDVFYYALWSRWAAPALSDDQSALLERLLSELRSEDDSATKARDVPKKKI